MVITEFKILWIPSFSNKWEALRKTQVNWKDKKLVIIVLENKNLFSVNSLGSLTWRLKKYNSFQFD